MRVVADTNIIISGLFWRSAPRQILDLARAKEITLFTSPALLAELRDVLGREKFAAGLFRVGQTSNETLARYAALATLVHPKSIQPVVKTDPDDDIVLACAIAAQAEVIVSGDSHLRDLKTYQSIPILSATVFLEQFKKEV